MCDPSLLCPSAPGEVALGAAGWFYGIFVALLLLILVIALFLWGKRQRDKWWAKQGQSTSSSQGQGQPKVSPDTCPKGQPRCSAQGQIFGSTSVWVHDAGTNCVEMLGHYQGPRGRKPSGQELDIGAPKRHRPPNSIHKFLTKIVRNLPLASANLRSNEASWILLTEPAL